MVERCLYYCLSLHLKCVYINYIKIKFYPKKKNFNGHINVNVFIYILKMFFLMCDLNELIRK